MIFKIRTIPTLKAWWVEFIYLIYSQIKLMLLISSPNFCIYIYLFQTDLFHPKFMISAMNDFDILIYFPFLDGYVPHSTSYGVNISQCIRFARVSSHVTDFNARNKILTTKPLHRGYRYIKLFQFFIADTMNWFQYLKSYLSLCCNRAYHNKNLIVTWFIN